MMRQTRQHDEKHLTFIRSLCCIVCMDDVTVEAAHVRFSDARAAKKNSGVGAKPDDRWTVPLCGQHHRMQHSQGERGFWKAAGIDPIFVALALYSVSGDQERGNQIVSSATHKFEAA